MTPSSIKDTRSSATPSIWIDLDNSPHVPFFSPIIKALEDNGYRILLTARDAYQVCDLADLFGYSYIRVGRHYGKNVLLKAAGTVLRSLQLLRIGRHHRPLLALSHGSRSQLLTATLLGIPSIMMLDYEFVASVPMVRPTWIMTPMMLSVESLRCSNHKVMQYPGIKEDVYISGFKPNPTFRKQLGLADEDLVVTLRPPANEAHYHNSASEELLEAIVLLFAEHATAKVILVPRNKRQEDALRRKWPRLFETKKLMIPAKAVDGLNLIWHSDLVVSGGGTMNREAAALGVPVYSIFRGEIGAVDRYLAQDGRLVLLETADDVRNKVRIRSRERSHSDGITSSDALTTIVRNIVSTVESIGANAPLR